MEYLIKTIGTPDTVALTTAFIVPIILIWLFIYIPPIRINSENFDKPRGMLTCFFILAFGPSGLVATWEYFSARFDGYAPSYELLSTSVDYTVGKVTAIFIASIPLLYSVSFAYSLLAPSLLFTQEKTGLVYKVIRILVFIFIAAPGAIASEFLLSNPLLSNLMFGKPILLNQLASLNRSVYLGTDYPVRFSVMIEQLTDNLGLQWTIVSLVAFIATLATILNLIINLSKHLRETKSKVNERDDHEILIIPNSEPIINDPMIPDFNYRREVSNEEFDDSLPPPTMSDEELDHYLEEEDDDNSLIIP